jgi:glutamyl-tRNA synthetase/glutamyl-Q tRNA(Asp) synthetase
MIRRASRETNLGAGEPEGLAALRPALDRLRARLPAAPLTRFAPAPTGRLHLGHVANALVVWGVAGALGGRVLLRIEDHDRQRCRPEYERELLDDLDWLGFAPDAFPTAAYRAGRCDGRQSDRDAAHRAAADALAARGLLYACACSRREIGGAMAEAASGEGAELRYPGTCRERGVPLDAPDVAWRVRLPDGEERFDDALLGPQRQTPGKQCGDVAVRDRRGNWTYQLAVTVDDRDQEVSLVIRGQDLLASTGRQLQLARLLGRDAPPVYLHHGLLRKPSGRKLSKADGDSGVRALRTAGWAAADVIGAAAHRLGLLATAQPVPARAAPELLGGAR